MLTRNWTSFLTLTLVAINISGCKPSPQSQAKEPLKIMESFGKLTPRCVGRFLVELPEGFILNTQGGQEIEGVKLHVERSTEAAFASLLKARTLKLESGFVQGVDEKFPLLRKAIPLPGNVRGLVFDRAEDDLEGGRLSRVLELFAWRDGYSITGTISATDTTFPEYAGVEMVRKLDTDVPKKMENLIALFERVKGRADNEIPNQQGLCILNGFVAGPPRQGEEVNVFYHLATANDVFFQINTSSFAPEEDTILDRLKTIAPMIGAENGKVLRKGSRSVNDVEGNEIAFTELGDQDIDGRKIMTHHYIYEANSKKGNAQFPILTVDLTNGRHKPIPEAIRKKPRPPLVKATLSESDANGLWDTVIPTLRKNPLAF